MGWHAHLSLDYRRDGARTLVHDRHRGPLRILQSLYPEAPDICHNVLVHPPGGIVGGDVLELDLRLAARSHALLTTPGATRFYRSGGNPAMQSVSARVAEGARLEWLPLETLCHRGALAENRLRFELAPGAEMIGWDILGLGLPASGEAFDQGRVTQQIELPGVWLDRGIVDGSDTRLLDSPLGWAGDRVLATMWLAAGRPMPASRCEDLLTAARELAATHPLARRCGVEPAMGLLASVRPAWRRLAWDLAACTPRVWRT
jgi:urease accessory protein